MGERCCGWSGWGGGALWQAGVCCTPRVSPAQGHRRAVQRLHGGKGPGTARAAEYLGRDILWLVGGGGAR